MGLTILVVVLLMTAVKITGGNRFQLIASTHESPTPSSSPSETPLAMPVTAPVPAKSRYVIDHRFSGSQ